jgi:type III restriction enzyme
MKLHFEPDLDYQLEAIDAVCDLFRGQENCRTEFTVAHATRSAQHTLGIIESELGIGNRLVLSDEAMLGNLRAIQLRHGLAASAALESGDFTVEMETGTGKTYVYLRTIFELNKRYGFTKFVIVVPSIAIKEGVYKTLQMTEEHFRSMYAGLPSEYFLYDSAKLGQVRTFATSAVAQIMVVTVGAINKKDVNNLYKDSEQINDERPIDLIKATHPIIIVDEPQSVDGGLNGAGKTALEAMNPLCTLRYSATHVTRHHMVYRLDAVDAYERKLVKQIEVASATVEDAHNRPYVRLEETSNRRDGISARVAVDVQSPRGVRRKIVTVQDGDDLEALTGRALYRGCTVGEIRVGRDVEMLELRAPGGEIYLRRGESWGDLDALVVQREMIRRTIREHLEKERRLRPRGIKVLSLFFIDAVERYRQYDDQGNAVKGPYALIFEEEYRRLAGHPDNAAFVGATSAPIEDRHNGYFSIDRRGGWTNTEENNQANRESAERAYNLIMKDKERLLDFATPLSFIFSHSALREGWDNPNIFQICTLRDVRTERERRQTIGRGLRLCVDQSGARVRGFDVNTLTVVATESYEDFAEGLQREIERDTGIRFGVVEEHQFTGLSVADADGVIYVMAEEESKAVWEHLRDSGYLTSQGDIQDSLRVALREGSLELPVSAVRYADQVTALLRRLAGRHIDVRNAEDRRTLKAQRAVLDSADFRQLWERIKCKTTYRVQFDNAKLIDDCIRELRDAPPIARARLQWRKADIAIGRAGLETIERAGAATVVLNEADLELPDILTELQDRTRLTRRTIQQVLLASARLDDFKRNPQLFIELAAGVINRCKQMAIVSGIKYQQLGDDHYYAQELFEQEELTGYLRQMVPDTQSKSVYDQVLYESDIEATFAERLEHNTAVKVFVKLPGWFVIPTPLGTYSPDWAVLIEDDGRDRLYLVVETKGSSIEIDLRAKEWAKIKCGRAHFTALRVHEPPAEYVVAPTLEDVLSQF